MAGGKQKKVVETVFTGNSDGLEATFKKLDQQGAAYAQNAGKHIKKASTEADGFFARLAAKSKEYRREQRMSGETALMRTLGSGQGLTTMAMQSLGMGLPAMITEMVGKGFASSMEGVKKALTEGGADATKNIAESLPLLGEFVKGWESVIELVTGVAQAEAEVNRELKSQQQIQDQLNVTHNQRFQSAQIVDHNALRKEVRANVEESNNALKEYNAKHVGEGEATPDQIAEHFKEKYGGGVIGWGAANLAQLMANGGNEDAQKDIPESKAEVEKDPAHQALREASAQARQSMQETLRNKNTEAMIQAAKAESEHGY